jgi:osmotically-inducible protein OsmY
MQQGCAGKTVPGGTSGYDSTPGGGSVQYGPMQQGCAGKTVPGGTSGYDTTPGGASVQYGPVQQGCAGKTVPGGTSGYDTTPGGGSVQYGPVQQGCAGKTYSPGTSGYDSAPTQYGPAQQSYSGGQQGSYFSQTTPSYRGQYYYTTDPGVSEQPGMEQAGSEQDTKLTQDIRSAISSGLFTKGYDNIAVRVSNGFVTLNGRVSSIEDRNKIEEKIRGLSGVRSINNQIIVDTTRNGSTPRTSGGFFSTLRQQDSSAQDYGATPSDRAVNTRIRDRLSGGWFTKGYELVILKTNNGNVVIEGSVLDANDIAKIVDEIKKVDGVRSVRNNLSVKAE